MKTGTLDKMKFLVFKNSLGIPRYQAIGLLEGLWYLTATNAPDGAIGRFTDVEIAAWLEWGGDPAALIKSFLLGRFIDPCKNHRLVVHDWEDHAPQHIKGNIAKHGKTFAKAEIHDAPWEPPLAASHESSHSTLPDPMEDAPSYSNLTKPNQTKPEIHHSVARAADTPARATSPGELSKSLRALTVDVTSQNPVLLAWIADGFTVEQLVEAAEIARERKPGERIPAKYLDAILRGQASQEPTSRDKPNGKTTGPPWWSSEASIKAKGEELGLHPRGGESWQAYKGRIEAKLQEEKREGQTVQL